MYGRELQLLRISMQTDSKLSSRDFPLRNHRTNASNAQYMNFTPSSKPTLFLENVKHGRVGTTDTSAMIPSVKSSKKSVQFSEILVAENDIKTESNAMNNPLESIKRASTPLKSILSKSSSSSTVTTLLSTELSTTLPSMMNSRSELPPKKILLQRPSFQDQLQSITMNIEKVNLNLNSKLNPNATTNIDQMLFSIATKSFMIGSLTCKHPSPMKFYSTHFTYIFYHPYEATEILLQFYYKDLDNFCITSTMEISRFRFRINSRLIQFDRDYDCKNPFHVIVIEVFALNKFNRDRIISLLRLHKKIS